MIYRKPETEIEHLAHLKAYDSAVQVAAFCYEAGGDYARLAYQVYMTNYPRYVLAIRAVEDAVQIYQESIGEIAKQPTNEELLRLIEEAGNASAR